MSANIENDSWLLIAEDEGRDGNGRVLGYIVCESEKHAESYASCRREVCDWMNLYEDCPIADDFSIEVMQYWDFKESYGDKMPLRNRIESY